MKITTTNYSPILEVEKSSGCDRSLQPYRFLCNEQSERKTVHVEESSSRRINKLRTNQLLVLFHSIVWKFNGNHFVGNSTDLRKYWNISLAIQRSFNVKRCLIYN